jgi:hypothetical protein
MRVELQFSYVFFADYLAGKVIKTVAPLFPVGTTLPIANLVTYQPEASPSIANAGAGAVEVDLKFGLLTVKLVLSAVIANNQVQIKATVANAAELSPYLNGAAIPPLQAPLDINALLAVAGAKSSDIAAPTQAGFAADASEQLVALRIEIGAATPMDAAVWADFTANHTFTPIFHSGDVTAHPPRHWAAAIDWQVLQPAFKAQIKPVIADKLKGLSGHITGDLLFAWGLKKDDQPAGFADGWPFDTPGAAALDVTCAANAQGHDGHVYIQAALSSGGSNRLHVKAKIKAHVSCCWKDADPVSMDVPLGPFAFDVNVLVLDKVRTNTRALVLQGGVDFYMPLLFPTPELDVGAFSWGYLDTCDASTICQIMSVAISDGTVGGPETPLLSKLTISAPFPFSTTASATPDAKGVYAGAVEWAVLVKKADIPAAGGSVTLSVQTNAGTPPLPAGESLVVPLLPPLTTDAQTKMALDAQTACIAARVAGVKTRYTPGPPEEIIWWLTQELVISAKTGAMTVAAGPASRVAVPAASVAASVKQLRANPHGAILKQSVSAAGMSVVHSSVQRASARVGISARRLAPIG